MIYTIQSGYFSAYNDECDLSCGFVGTESWFTILNKETGLSRSVKVEDADQIMYHTIIRVFTEDPKTADCLLTIIK